MSQRGPHSADEELFAPRHHAALVDAVADFSWLLSRGYAETSTEKLVGDRYNLRKRQREAVRRSACSDVAKEARARSKVAPDEVKGAHLAIDGLNCLITLEAALGGGLLLLGQDRRLRDLASVHGSYRSVKNTLPAIELFCAAISKLGPRHLQVFLDAPVSNSGKLRGLLLDSFRTSLSLPFDVHLVADPDKDLVVLADAVVVSSDAWILDQCKQTFDLAHFVVEPLDDVWMLDLGAPT